MFKVFPFWATKGEKSHIVYFSPFFFARNYLLICNIMSSEVLI
jgi:hypothetical protein